MCVRSETNSTTTMISSRPPSAVRLLRSCATPALSAAPRSASFSAMGRRRRVMRLNLSRLAAASAQARHDWSMTRKASRSMLPGGICSWCSRKERCSALPSPATPPATSAPSARKGNESSAGMNDQASSAERRKKPHKVLVVGHVSAYSPDMILRNAKQLTVWFQDVSLLPSGSQASAVPQPVPANNMSSSSTIVPLASLQSNEDALTASSSPTPFQPGPQELKIPLEVSAEIVESFIVRSGSSNELDRVYCKDHVEVHQEPKDPKDRALDIRCRELDLTHTPDGDRVRLRGTDSEWAMVQAQTMTLFGPKVMFDQKDNRAEIED